MSLSTTTNQTIGRDASDSNKGLRLQKLRALEVLLQECARSEAIQAYATIEAHGDVTCTSATHHDTATYSEENKNYVDSSLSLMSHPVLNTLVNFVDTWVQWKFSSTLRFGFYATANIAKEHNTKRTKELGFVFPERPILMLLQHPDAAVVPIVKAAVLDEYETQYSGRRGGYLQDLRSWGDATWLDFLRRIHWSFGGGDHVEAERRAIAAIQRSPNYTNHHIGREPLLLATLLELLERKHLASDYAQKFVHASDVRAAFQDVAASPVRLLDPTWSEWDRLPPPVDRRNIEEKILHRCPTIAARVIENYQRKTAAAHAELRDFAHDRAVQALQFQVYDECLDQLGTLKGTAQLSQDTLESTIEQLVSSSIARVKERSRSYGFALQNDVTIRGIVLALLDRCFLSLDGTSL